MLQFISSVVVYLNTCHTHTLVHAAYWRHVVNAPQEKFTWKARECTAQWQLTLWCDNKLRVLTFSLSLRSPLPAQLFPFPQSFPAALTVCLPIIKLFKQILFAQMYATCLPSAFVTHLSFLLLLLGENYPPLWGLWGCGKTTQRRTSGWLSCEISSQLAESRTKKRTVENGQLGVI